jgi:CRP/FNR family cyclic AMP-dependent transcriptional regulator
MVRSEFRSHKNRAATIEALKKKLLESPAPSARTRLQLADMLVMAGKEVEAIPLLLGIADEFAADGFVAKAVAILKRVEKIEPGREDVASKLSILVGEQVRLTPSVTVPAQGLPETGFDDILKEIERDVAALESADEGVAPFLGVAFLDDDSRPALLAEVSHERTTSSPVPESHHAAEDHVAFAPTSVSFPPEDTQPYVGSEPAPSPIDKKPEVERADADQAAAPIVEALGVDQPEVEEESAAVRPGDDAARAGPSVARRIRSVLRKFLSSLPLGAHVADKPERESEALAEEQPVTASPELEEADLREAFALAEGETLSEEGETLSDEEFHSRVIDLVEDVLRRPYEARPADDVSRTTDLGARLVATPLFSELSEAELRAVVAGLELRTFESGDVLVTEGEPGQALWILTSGQAKVFVRNPAGYDVEVARLDEGDFFGELSALSGRRRSATITAACACEVLELDKSTLDAIAQRHKRVRETLEAVYVKRASSPEAAAVRAVNLPDRRTKRKAIEILEAYFGESRWRPRMRLRLADVLLKSGKDDAAVPILVGLAEDLVRAGYPEKAIALLKKIERIQHRSIVEIHLAPKKHAAEEEALDGEARTAEGAEAREAAHREPDQAHEQQGFMFHQWLLKLAIEGMPEQEAQETRFPIDEESARTALHHYGPGLHASPLFESFSDDELLAVVRGVRLVSYEPGDIVLTEGEAGQSVFILAVGSVSVMVRNSLRHNVKLCRLDEGAFFGEIATLSGQPRCATVTAVKPCELLELDKVALDAIVAKHPRVFQVLDEYYVKRAGNAEAARIRTGRTSKPIGEHLDDA